MPQPQPLDLLLGARRVGYVFPGGSARCAFQVGALETLRELGVRPALCIGVSAGAWNAAAVATDTDRRLRHYWRSFVRMPAFDLRNLLRERSPFRFAEAHRRTFSRYVGTARLRAPEALPLWVGVTRLRDRRPMLIEARQVEDPFTLLLASNFLPPFYTLPPRLGGEAYGDGALTDNIPYERAFLEGCDAVVLFAMRGESEGGLRRNHRAEEEHVVPAAWRDRLVILRPRHRLPVGFAERRWPLLQPIMEIGRLRAREVLLGESHPETEARAPGTAPTERLRRLLFRRPAPPIPPGRHFP